MARILAVVFLAVLLDIAWSQLEDDGDQCVCVDVWKCENGYVSDPSVIPGAKPPPPTEGTELPFDGAGLIDPRMRTCDGLQVCCPLPPTGQPPVTTPARTPPPTTGGSGHQIANLPQVARLQGCGVKRFPAGQPSPELNSLRISGAPGIVEETFYGEVPWMARILINGQFVCGATIISQQVVLTAAHCVNDKRLGEIEIEVGEWDTTSDREPLKPQKLSPINLVYHPNFNSKNLRHDVALIFLRTPVKLTEVVDFVCTPDNHKDIDDGSCVAVGWGREDIGSQFQLKPILRKVYMPLMQRDVCQNHLRTTRLGQRFTLLPGFICAGGVSNGDTCKGDGGGPLYCNMKSEPNRMAIVGVTAWGIECGKGNPTVFSSVPDHVQWITQQLNNERLYEG